MKKKTLKKRPILGMATTKLMVTFSKRGHVEFCSFFCQKISDCKTPVRHDLISLFQKVYQATFVSNSPIACAPRP